MYTTIPLVALSTNTTAFRAFGSQLSAFFTSIGVVQTTDTGQVDWFTVNASGSQQTSVGYEVRTFTDSLSASNPWYVKIEYGTGGNNNGFGMWFSFGTATDGEGNLTTQVSNRFPIGFTDGNANPQYCYLAGTPGGFTLDLFDGPNVTEPMFFNVERTRDSSGNVTGTGLIVQYISQLYGRGQTVHPHSGTIATPAAYWSAAVNYAEGSMQSGTQVATVSPIPFNFIPYNPGINCLIYQGTDIGAYSQITVPLYGTNHTYLAINQTASPTAHRKDENNNDLGYDNTRILMRFE
jgi:hypothetical protein